MSLTHDDLYPPPIIPAPPAPMDDLFRTRTGSITGNVPFGAEVQYGDTVWEKKTYGWIPKGWKWSPAHEHF